MEAIVLQKKRKNIDLPIDTLQKLSIMAASQGKSLKAFIENILISKADSLEIEVTNPSPSKDPFFDNSDNLTEIQERVNDLRKGNAKTTVVLRTAEDITNFLNDL